MLIRQCSLVVIRTYLLMLTPFQLDETETKLNIMMLKFIQFLCFKRSNLVHFLFPFTLKTIFLIL